MSDVDIIEEVVSQCNSYIEEEEDWLEDMDEEDRAAYLKEVEEFEKMTQEEKDEFFRKRHEEELKKWNNINF